MQHVLVALQLEKSSCYSILVFQFHSLDVHLARYATGYGGLLSDSLNHVWASQAMLSTKLKNKRNGS